MKLTPTTEADLSQIGDWITADSFHQGQSAMFWLTGSDCLFAARVEDKRGVVAYARVEEEETGYRIHAQFAPEDIVSRRRVARAIVNFIVTMKAVANTNKKQRLITESENPDLIVFLAGLGFLPGEGHDYILKLDNKDS